MRSEAVKGIITSARQHFEFFPISTFFFLFFTLFAHSPACYIVLAVSFLCLGFS